jgi:hypothetical protein
MSDIYFLILGLVKVSVVSHPLIVFWVLDVGPSLWESVAVAVDVSPRGQTEKSGLAAFLHGKRTARVAGADRGVGLVSADDGIVDGLSGPD